MSKTFPRYDKFQIMRGVACLVVFLNHVAGLLSSNIIAQQPDWLAPLIVPLGFPWVWMFLTLSGFLLTKAFVTKRYALTGSGIFAFCQSRGWRLFPALWFAALLWFSLYYASVWSSLLPDFSFWRELRIALALPWIPYSQSAQAIASSNSPVWSAVIEINLSLALPLFLFATAARARWLLALLAAWIVWAIWLALIRPEIFPMIYGQHIYNIGFFAGGMLLATIPRPLFLEKLSWPVMIGIVVMAVVAVQYGFSVGANATLAVSPVPMLIVWCMLVWKADDEFKAPLPRSLSDLASRRYSAAGILELCGMASYTIYLLHKPLAYILIEKIGLLKFVSGTASLVALTVLTFMCLVPIFLFGFIAVERNARTVLARRPGSI